MRLKIMVLNPKVLISVLFAALVISGQVSAQQRTVQGSVVDSKGSPMPGVTVVVKGSTWGTVTDGEGLYTLTNVSESSILEYSFVGMKSQEILVRNQSVINITLVEESIGIDEVVAVGYGTQKRINLTGSVGMVEAKEFETRPVTSVVQSLQGESTRIDGQPNRRSTRK